MGKVICSRRPGTRTEEVPMSSRPMLFALAAVLAACQTTETTDQTATRMARESAEATATIRGLSNDFARLFTAGQWDSVAAMYTPDAIVMAPNAPSMTGRDAIRAGFTGMAQMGSATLTLQADTVLANGPLAVEQGRWTTSVTTPAGATMADSGKYLVQWWKTDAGWRLARDIWNSDVPLPQGTRN
jgi:ketosteroid isomerase-like protein